MSLSTVNVACHQDIKADDSFWGRALFCSKNGEAIYLSIIILYFDSSPESPATENLAFLM